MPVKNIPLKNMPGIPARSGLPGAVLFSLFIATLLVAPFVGDLGAEETRRTLRVLTYNIHHGAGNDGKIDLERIAKVIRAAEPDLVALQEVDQKAGRSGQVAQTAELARLTGLQGKFARQIDYDGGEYGQAILSKWPLAEIEIHLLPGEPPRERRIVAGALVDLDGHSLWFGTTHLHHADQAIREGQVEALNALFADRPYPVIVAGDFNATPDSAAMRRVAAAWQIAGQGQTHPTFPSARPTRQIDYVAARPAAAWKTVSVEVIDEPLASDHAPLLVILEARPHP